MKRNVETVDDRVRVTFSFEKTECSDVVVSLPLKEGERFPKSARSQGEQLQGLVQTASEEDNLMVLGKTAGGKIVSLLVNSTGMEVHVKDEELLSPERCSLRDAEELARQLEATGGG